MSRLFASYMLPSSRGAIKRTLPTTPRAVSLVFSPSYMAPRRKRARRLRSKGERKDMQNQSTDADGQQFSGPQDTPWQLLRQSHSAEEVILYKPKRLSGIASVPSQSWESPPKTEKSWFDRRWDQEEYGNAQPAGKGGEEREKGRYQDQPQVFPAFIPQEEEYGGVPISSTHINFWSTAKEGTPSSSNKRDFPDEESQDDDGKPTSGDQSVTVSTMYQQLNIVNSNNQKGRTHITGNHVHVQTRDYHSYGNTKIFPGVNSAPQNSDSNSVSSKSIKTSKPPTPSSQRGIHKSAKKMPCPVLPPMSSGDSHRVDSSSNLHIPEPTEEYLNFSVQENSKQLPPPYQPILVVLDLNGALLARSKYLKPYEASKRPIPRPGLTSFLDYLFQNFHVMVWSSAQPRNVAAMVDAIFTPEQKARLLAVWARDTLGLSPAEMRKKVVVYKDLNRIWGKEHRIPHPLAGASDKEGTEPRWNQFNTVLIDDSPVKAKNQPYNHIEVSEWDDPKMQSDDAALMRVTVYLEVLKKQSNVSAFIRKMPFLLG